MSTTPALPPFPVDDETLNVIRDSLDRVVTDVPEDGGPWTYAGSLFGLDDVLNLLSGYDESKLVPMVNEYDQPIPDWYEYVGGAVYHPHDLIRALIDEIRRLRAHAVGTGAWFGAWSCGCSDTETTPTGIPEHCPLHGRPLISNSQGQTKVQLNHSGVSGYGFRQGPLQ